MVGKGFADEVELLKVNAMVQCVEAQPLVSVNLAKPRVLVLRPLPLGERGLAHASLITR
jgi:hypothetical protein